MQKLIATIVCLIGLICMAQQEPAPEMQHTQDGGERTVLEGIVVPPIPHSPFTAMLTTEWTKYTADGASMTLANQRRIARDEKGRVYQERWYLVPQGGKVESKMNWRQIGDPVQKTLYNCSTERKVCDLLVYDPNISLSSLKPQKKVSGKLANDQGEVVWEDLGGRTVAGMETTGTRQTTTLNPGTLGNDRPIVSTSEYWHSDKLGINLLSTRTDPMSGKQSFTITELTVGAPDPQLFELPAGYKVNDQRKDPPISH